MLDKFPYASGISGAREFFAITPNDGADLEQMPKCIWVGTGGDISVIGLEGSAPVLIENVPDGTRLDIQPTRVRATGTTATGLVGWV